MAFTSACQACNHPIPDGADIAVELFGSEPTNGLTARALTKTGEGVLTHLDLPPAEAEPPQRKSVIAAILEQRKQYREQMFTTVAKATGSIQGLSTYLADCVNCYNCRAACPVCYCTTCVFTTDTFRHEPFQYLQWARRKGGVKMPTDTLFFHLTRMAHISTACVGCGQCTNACPNDIPLSDLFTTGGPAYPGRLRLRCGPGSVATPAHVRLQGGGVRRGGGDGIVPGYGVQRSGFVFGFSFQP